MKEIFSTEKEKTPDDADISTDFVAIVDALEATADSIVAPQIPYETFALSSPVAPDFRAAKPYLIELSGVLNHSLYELSSCLIAGRVFDAVFELSRERCLRIIAARLASEEGALEPGAWEFERNFGGAVYAQIWPKAAAEAGDIFAFGEAVLAAAAELELQIAAAMQEGADADTARVLGDCDALSQLEGAAAAAEQAAELLEPEFCLHEAAADAEQLGEIAQFEREKIAEKLAALQAQIAELAAEQIPAPSVAGSAVGGAAVGGSAAVGGENPFVARGFYADASSVRDTLRGFGKVFLRAQGCSPCLHDLLK